MRRHFHTSWTGSRTVLTAMLFVLCLTSATWAADKSPPNILMIIADDLNNDLGCYGNPIVKSPNIDRLASRGMRFDRAYCQFPVCNASRVSFLSGLRPDTTGIHDLETPPRTTLGDYVFMPQYFRQHGYTTLKVGKIFHTGDAFEDPRSWDRDIRETREAKNPPQLQLVRKQGNGGVVIRAADADTYDGKVAVQAKKQMEEAAKTGKPFFLAVGFRRPHSPYIAPEKYFALYPPDKMPVPQEPSEHLKHIPRAALTYPPGEAQLADAERRATTAAYYASVSFMDAQVGVLLDALDAAKLADNTIIVFMSDHGYHLGEHGGLQHKMTVFEESARVPLIIAAPGKKAGAACNRLVEYVDLFPTLTQLAGLSAPAGLEATSMAPLLDKPEQPWKKAAFTQVFRKPSKMTGRSVRTERWRYTEWNGGKDGVELYDHDSDPKEYRNLAEDPAYTSTVAELKKLLHDGWKAALPPTPAVRTAAAEATAADAPRWNLLIVTADDMNADSPGWMGNKLSLTPNLDAFAATAHRFVNNHVSAPICQPSRSALMTGLVPHRNGALGFHPIKPGTPTLPARLRDAGWFTAVINKHEHMKPDAEFPWDLKLGGSGKNPTLFGEQVAACIRKAAEERKPFFLNANITDPHRPFANSQQGETQKQNPKKAAKRGGDAAIEALRPDEVGVPSFLEDIPDVRREVAEYYTSVHRFDASFGELMKALTGRERDTVVVFLSDHGMSFPFSKATVYRNGTWSPVLIRWPGMGKPQVHQEFVSSVDIVPTLLELMKQAPLAKTDGRSWIPLLAGESQPDRDFVITHVNTVSSGKSFPQRCVRTKESSYQFHAWPNGKPQFRVEAMNGLTYNALARAAKSDEKIKNRVDQLVTGVREQFFDLKSDPDERVNLIANPSYRDQIERMRNLLLAHMEKTADPQLDNFRKVLKP